MEMLTDLMENNKQLAPFFEFVDGIMQLPDEGMSDEMMNSLLSMIDASFTPGMKNEAVREIIKTFREQSITRTVANEQIDNVVQALKDFITDLNPSRQKKLIFDKAFSVFYEIFDTVSKQYLTYDIELPMTLAEGATVPTYAHNTDAAADLYVVENMKVPAHNTGILAHTGVKIQLPEGWLAFVMPRSGMSKNTPIRISNAPGLIDSSYRGEVCVLLDNISDTDYTIEAGTRIAQLLVMPNYHFTAKVVENLDETERGEGGFGSTGQ